MTLLDRIKATSLIARKARDTVTAASLTTLLGEIETLSKAGRGEVTDEAIVTVVKKFIKNIDENLRVLGQTDGLVLDAMHAEKELYSQFLPKQLTEDELLGLINKMVGEGAKNVGDCMKRLKLEHAGTYDGATASRLLKAVFA